MQTGASTRHWRSHDHRNSRLARTTWLLRCQKSVRQLSIGFRQVVSHLASTGLAPAVVDMPVTVRIPSFGSIGAGQYSRLHGVLLGAHRGPQGSSAVDTPVTHWLRHFIACPDPVMYLGPNAATTAAGWRGH